MFGSEVIKIMESFHDLAYIMHCPYKLSYIKWFMFGCIT